MPGMSSIWVLNPGRASAFGGRDFQSPGRTALACIGRSDETQSFPMGSRSLPRRHRRRCRRRVTCHQEWAGVVVPDPEEARLQPAPRSVRTGLDHPLWPDVPFRLPDLAVARVARTKARSRLVGCPTGPEWPLVAAVLRK